MDNTPYRILYIEDNAGDLLLVEEYLHEHLLRPELIHRDKFIGTPESLKEKENRPDIILLDLSLPDINREDLIKEASQIAQTSPVIILTGYADLDLAVKSLSLGISDYLVKDTINPLLLYKSILYAIERHKYILSLKESEKRYISLFDFSPAPMYVFDQDSLKFLDVNEAAVRHYGYSKEEFLSMTLKDIRPESEWEKLRKSINNFSPEYYKGPFIHRKKSGEVIEVDIVSNRINFKGENAEIVLATDITEKLHHMRAIEKQNIELKDIAWTQSHVVRAPLARMMGLIDLLKKEKLNEVEKKKYLEYVCEAAEEIDSVVKDIVSKSGSAVKRLKK